MEDKKSIIESGKQRMKVLAQQISETARLAVGKDLQGEGERIASKKLRRAIFFNLLYFTLSWLFSLTKLLFEATPLGLALFFATVGRYAYAGFAGLFLAAFFSEHIFIALLIPTVGLVLRLAIGKATQRELFRETAGVRVALAAALAFLQSFSLAAMGAFSMASIYALLFAVVATPTLTRLFLFSTDRGKLTSFAEVGRLAILFFFVYALNAHGIFSFSLGLCAGFFITLSVAITNGALRGTLIGLVTGLACGLPFSPIFAVAGLVTGLCSNLSLTYSVIASLVLASVMNLYLNGSQGALLFMGDLFFAVLLFLPLAKGGLIPQVAIFAEEPCELPDMKYISDQRQKFRQNRLRALSSAFEELSDIFLELSEKSRRPGGFELHEAGDEVLARYCKKCALNNICWQRDGSETGEAMDKLIAKLQKGEVAQAKDLPEAFRARCRHMEKIIREINNAAADLVEKAIRRDKTELFALDYEAMAELLNETATEGEEEFEADKSLCKKVRESFKSLGIECLGTSAFGVRKKTVLASGVEISSLSVSGKEIKESLDNATGLSFSEPHFDFSGDFVTMQMESCPAIKAVGAFSSFAKEENAVSGDALSHFEGSCGNDFFLLCDGMGSGKVAAVTAKISTVFLEKMLAAGNKKGVVLKMLSTFLRSKSEECHSTCDLLELDLYASRAIFTKCGAAPSFVLHAGSLFRVDCRSVPVGITRDIAVKEIETPVTPGDLIIMMSDGVAPFGEDVFRLSEVLTDASGLSEKEIADKVLALAKTASSEQEALPDDASVIVIRVTAA